MIGRDAQCMLQAAGKLAPYQCHVTQCQLCKDYQAGKVKPAFPVPATMDTALMAVFAQPTLMRGWFITIKVMELEKAFSKR